MKPFKLFITCLLLVVFNFAGIYFLFYYDKILYSVEIDRNGAKPVVLNNKEDELIFWQTTDEQCFLSFYNLKDKTCDDYLVDIDKKIQYWDKLNISPDDNHVFFSVTDGKIKTKYCFNRDDGKVESVKQRYNIEGYSKFDSGNSRFRGMEVGEKYLLFSADKEDGTRGGLIVYDIELQEMIDIIEMGRVPKLSPTGESFAYIKLISGGGSFDLYEYRFSDKKRRMIYSGFENYVRTICWAPDGKKIAVSYGKSGDSNASNVAIVSLDGEKIDIGNDSDFVFPIWMDGNSLVMGKYKNKWGMSWVKTMCGGYIYNIETGKLVKITDKIKSDSFFLSSDNILYISRGKTLYSINIQEYFNPNFLNKVRENLKIIKS